MPPFFSSRFTVRTQSVKILRHDVDDHGVSTVSKLRGLERRVDGVREHEREARARRQRLGRDARARTANDALSSGAIGNS